jgi:hypothetical protein
VSKGSVSLIDNHNLKICGGVVMKKEKQFWDWFVENKCVYENILVSANRTKQDEVDLAMNLFESELHKYEKNLWFRMGGSNPYELIITAEGNKSLFFFFSKLVEASPSIYSWTIVPFIQPTNIFEFHYKEGDYELCDKDIFFSYSENPSGPGGYYFEVMFYVEDNKFIKDDGFKSSIIRISENALGEYKFASSIGFIDVVPKSEVYQKHKSGLLPIYKLAEIVNQL